MLHRLREACRCPLAGEMLMAPPTDPMQPAGCAPGGPAHAHAPEKAPADSGGVRRVTLGRLAPAELMERLAAPGPEATILAEIICAMYWSGRGGVDLRRVELLSPANWTLAVDIMAYRRSHYWSEHQFHVIAQWCRERHGLAFWDAED